MHCKPLPILTEAQLSKLMESTIIDPVTECWMSTLALDKDGYATLTILVDKAWSKFRTHRLVYRYYRRDPQQSILDHIVCDSRNCYNPYHVEESTPQKNTLRSLKAPAAINARRIICINGHDFDQTVERLDKDGKIRCRRVCTICKNELTKNAFKRRKNERLTKIRSGN